MTKFYLQTRRNDTLAIVDPQVDDYEKFEAVLRFKAEGTWQLTMRMESQHAAQFLPQAINGGGYPYGLLLMQDNEDGTPPFIIMSGPHRRTQRQVTQEDTQPLIASGFSDLVYIKDHIALPQVDYPYTGSFFDGVHTAPPYHYMFTTPVRYYKMNETSGTTAIDYSGSAQNGSYVGGVTLGQPGIIDDPTTCVKLDGTTGYLNVPTTGLPTGNAAWTMFAWGYFTANPAASVALCYLGANIAKEEVFLLVQSNGFPVVGGNGLTNIVSATAVPLNQPFLLAMTYDGTTLTGLLNGVAFGSSTPGPLSIAYGSVQFGAVRAASNFWPSYQGHGVFVASAVSASTLLQIYQTGINRAAYNSFDIRPTSTAFPVAPGFASSVIWQYVNYNAGPGALPAATAINLLGTRDKRVTPNLTMGPDPLIGSQITGAARFDNLLTLIQAMALQSSPELGFACIQSGQQLLFTVFTPTDRTATAIFSREIGNVLDSSWEIAAAEGNYIYAGGLNTSGSLTNRLVYEGLDQQSIGRFGHIETFLDYRKTSQANSLQTAITGKLAEVSAKRNVNATVLDTPALYFGGPGNKGYNLGDKVTVILDGLTFTDIVREVKITLEPGKPAVVTPAIGTPIDGAIISELDVIFKRLRGDDASFTLIQGNY